VLKEEQLKMRQAVTEEEWAKAKALTQEYESQQAEHKEARRQAAWDEFGEEFFKERFAPFMIKEMDQKIEEQKEFDRGLYESRLEEQKSKAKVVYGLLIASLIFVIWMYNSEEHKLRDQLEYWQGNYAILEGHYTDAYDLLEAIDVRDIYEDSTLLFHYANCPLKTQDGDYLIRAESFYLEEAGFTQCDVCQQLYEKRIVDPDTISYDSIRNSY